MRTLIPAVSFATLALAATFAFAQGTPGAGPGYGPGYGMGGQGMGPGMMGDRAGRGPVREHMRAAYEACKDKPNQQTCMSEQYCAKSSDPAKCQAQAKEHQARHAQRIEQRQKMHEACNAKRGDELTSCLRGQHLALRHQRLDERQKAHEACNGKRGEALATCLGEQRQKLGHGWHRQRG